MVIEMRRNEMTGLEQGGERAEEGNESGQVFFSVSCFFPQDIREKRKKDIFNASSVLSELTERELLA